MLDTNWLRLCNGERKKSLCILHGIGIPSGASTTHVKESLMQSKELMNRLKSGDTLSVIDVRTGFEFKAGHIPGAIHAPTWKILLRLARLPSDRDAELVITCEHGPRAQIARGLLGFIGYRNMTLLDGHMHGWRQVGYPMEK